MKKKVGCVEGISIILAFLGIVLGLLFNLIGSLINDSSIKLVLTIFCYISFGLAVFGIVVFFATKIFKKSNN